MNALIAIRGGTVLTPTVAVEDGVVLVEGGKIVEVGVNVNVPAGAEIIDAAGHFVMPGMIDAHCHTGVFGDGVGEIGYDGNEMTDPITPHMRAIDAIHPEDIAFVDLREAGVTSINTGPGSGNLIGGQTAVIKTAGRTADEMVVLSPAAMKMALGENPKRIYGDQKKAPSTRMGNAAILREWLTKARGYLEKEARHAKKLADFRAGIDGATEPEPFDVDLRLEALAPVLRREIPTHIHAHRADDMMTAIRIAEEFDLDLVLVHATEGYKIANILSAREIPCIAGPNLFSRGKFEVRAMTPKNAGVLAKAGVKVAIQTDHLSGVKYLRYEAALAVSEGMDATDALRAITLTPAEILGVDDRVGSLAEGKDADILILSGHPLDVAYGRVVRVLIDGETINNRA